MRGWKNSELNCRKLSENLICSKLLHECDVHALGGGNEETGHRKHKVKVKGKAIPLQALAGLDGFQEVVDPHILTQSAHEGGKVASHTHRPTLPPRKYTW
jgi:hypothetical protein